MSKMFKKESMLSIRALDHELARLHSLLSSLDKDEDIEYNKVFEIITKHQELLENLVKRYNGLEY